MPTNYLEIAWKAIEHTRKIFHLGSVTKCKDSVSSKEKSEIFSKFQEEIDREKSEMLTKLREETNAIAIKIRRIAIWQDPFREQIRAISEICAKYGLGNCTEHAFVALSFLKEVAKYEKFSSTLCSMEGGDHYFVIISDTPLMGFDDKKENTIICDPWLGRAYPIQDFEKMKREHPKCYQGIPTIIEDMIPKDLLAVRSRSTP